MGQNRVFSIDRRGLYRKKDERDSCGIGCAADIKGRKSCGIARRGLKTLEREERRGVESADNKTGEEAACKGRLLR